MNAVVEIDPFEAEEEPNPFDEDVDSEQVKPPIEVQSFLDSAAQPFALKTQSIKINATQNEVGGAKHYFIPPTTSYNCFLTTNYRI